MASPRNKLFVQFCLRLHPDDAASPRHGPPPPTPAPSPPPPRRCDRQRGRGGLLRWPAGVPSGVGWRRWPAGVAGGGGGRGELMSLADPAMACGGGPPLWPAAVAFGGCWRRWPSAVVCGGRRRGLPAGIAGGVGRRGWVAARCGRRRCTGCARSSDHSPLPRRRRRRCCRRCGHRCWTLCRGWRDAAARAVAGGSSLRRKPAWVAGGVGENDGS